MDNSFKENKIMHLALGQFGEEQAIDFLKDKGYRIIAKNWRKARVEIDIVSHFEETIVFVEVKTRIFNTLVHPVFALNRKKQKSLFKACMYYLMENKAWGVSCQFDFIWILVDYPKNSPCLTSEEYIKNIKIVQMEHIQNAIDFSSAMVGRYSAWQPW